MKVFVSGTSRLGRRSNGRTPGQTATALRSGRAERSRGLLRVVHALPPSESRRPSIRPPFDDVRNQRPENRRELEAVPAIARRHDEPGASRVVIDPEVAVERVAIQAESAATDGGLRERRQVLAQETPEPGRSPSEGRARLIRVHAATGRMMSDLQRPIVERGKAIPAGAGDVGGPHGKARRLPFGRRERPRDARPAGRSPT